jgi:tellurite resistance protein TehA-like permease
LGLGGAAICQLGVVARNINFISAEFATVLHGAGVLIALLCFGYALIWIVFAVVTIATRFLKIHFSMAWWGFTFPLGTLLSRLTNLGTFGLCCIQLGKELDNSFFSILATIVSVCVLLLWIMVGVLTVYEGWKGVIFYAPCLAKLGDDLPESAPTAVPNTPSTDSENPTPQ